MVKLKQLLNSLQPYVWLETVETSRAIKEIALLGQETWIWDPHIGLRKHKEKSAQKVAPDAVLNVFIQKAAPNAILILINFHDFIKAPPVKAAFFNLADTLATKRQTVVVLSPVLQLPPEVERYFFVVDFELPDEKTLKEKAQQISKVHSISLSDEQAAQLAHLAKGLTTYEFSTALSLAFTSKAKDLHKFLFEVKAQLIRKNEVLDLYVPRPEDRFSMLGGLDNAKDFLRRAVRSELAKGALLLGVSGTGKSALAKALGNEESLPVVMLDFGKVFGSLVGQSEARMRSALRTVEAFRPCILFIDEIEKGLSGIRSSHLTDGGTGSRVFGSFLTWLNDRPDGIFVIATSNDIKKLPPEFLRAERWDAIFFVDLPTPEEREKIWEIWGKFYSVDVSQKPDDDGWTGAEIRSCCRIAKMLGVSIVEAANYIVPLSRTMAQEIEELRQWAKGRTIPASRASAMSVSVSSDENIMS